MRGKHPREREVEGGMCSPSRQMLQVAESWQELSCLPVPVGTPGSLLVHYTVMDQAPSPAPSPPLLCAHMGAFFPTPSLGAFLQTPEEYMSLAGPRGAPSPAVWASLPRQKNQTDFVTGSNTHTSNPSPSLPAGTSARVCPSESGRWTHHRVMEEQLPGLVKFLIAQHVHKVFKEITWDQRGHEQRRGPGRTVPSDTPTPHPSRVCT